MTLEIHVRGETVALSDETIDATWKHFADECRAMARDVLDGKFLCNDPQRFATEQEIEAQRYDAREGRMSLTFLQQAYYLQSGISVGILP